MKSPGYTLESLGEPPFEEVFDVDLEVVLRVLVFETLAGEGADLSGVLCVGLAFEVFLLELEFFGSEGFVFVVFAFEDFQIEYPTVTIAVSAFTHFLLATSVTLTAVHRVARGDLSLF